jgi:hypothetical protein
MKRNHLLIVALCALPFFFATGCKKDDKDPVDEKLPNLQTQVRVQVAFDDQYAAFKFVWKSQAKTAPAGFADVGKRYPGHFHDVLKHNGTKFDRLPGGERMQEDRVSFMIDKFTQGVAGFANATCAITCHTNMASHHLLNPGVIDHWHWRGGRSGPMGYAEDAAVNEVERIRDNLGTPPSKFIRAGGDRLREDQAALTGTGHGVLTEGFPRFVFNKGKVLGSYTIPGFFITNMNNQVVTNPYTELPGITDVTKNRSLLVVYQDQTFDPTDKVNALDLGYLVFVANSSVDHLPAHLQDQTTADFASWTNYCAAQSGIGVGDAAQALAKLNDVYQEWDASGKSAMVARSVSFIYNSDQHDIQSVHSYDADRNEWTVILYRKLNTGSNRDVDLSGLPTGLKYAFAFAMHDAGDAAISHNISMSYIVSNGDDADIKAKQVTSVKNADWNKVPYFDSFWVKVSLLGNWTAEWLKSAAHPGAGMLETSSCKSCHQDKLYSPLIQ